MRLERCETCRFADPDRTYPVPGMSFFCVRRAPVLCPELYEQTGLGDSASGRWPGVGKDNWCGEWEPREGDG